MSNSISRLLECMEQFDKAKTRNQLLIDSKQNSLTLALMEDNPKALETARQELIDAYCVSIDCVIELHGKLEALRRSIKT